MRSNSSINVHLYICKTEDMEENKKRLNEIVNLDSVRKDLIEKKKKKHLQMHSWALFTHFE